MSTTKTVLYFNCRTIELPHSGFKVNLSVMNFECQQPACVRFVCRVHRVLLLLLLLFVVCITSVLSQSKYAYLFFRWVDLAVLL